MTDEHGEIVSSHLMHNSFLDSRVETHHCVRAQVACVHHKRDQTRNSVIADVRWSLCRDAQMAKENTLIKHESLFLSIPKSPMGKNWHFKERSFNAEHEVRKKSLQNPNLRQCTVSAYPKHLATHHQPVTRAKKYSQ